MATNSVWKKRTQKPKAQSREHPYSAEEGSPLWKAVSEAITDLAENGDLSETTARPHIVGYICKKINEVAPQITSR